MIEALRGPDLAGTFAEGLTIVRPSSFPVPADALWIDYVRFGEHRYGKGTRNNAGQLLSLSMGARKGAKDDDPWVTDRDLARLSEFPDLTRLYVYGQFTDAGLRSIARLSALEHLSITSDAMTDAGLLHLAEIKGLTSLSATGRQITREGLDEIASRLPACEVYGRAKP